MPSKDALTGSKNQSGRPALSLILCSRNDQYMGNSRWRLQTALNYVSENVCELGLQNDVEVLVADWGSEIPLGEVLELSPNAARIVSFLLIPPDIARDLQKDSPFPEVLALNSAARRARGEYIGRIDQDTLVGKRFLKVFFDLYSGGQKLDVALHVALLFSNVRMVPFRFAVRCPRLAAVARFVRWFGGFIATENYRSSVPFYACGVGIWLVHRDLWHECGGYDERMIHMNGMETNMIKRLMEKYSMVNLGELVGYDFYHLEHYHPWVSRRSSTHRKVNRNSEFSQPDSLKPNGESWGLIEHAFQVSPGSREVVAPHIGSSTLELLSFIALMLFVGPQIACDALALSAKAAYRIWRHRAMLAWRTLYGEPLFSWPRLLKGLWMVRSSRKSPNSQPSRIP